MTKLAIAVLTVLASFAQAETAEDILKRWDVAAEDFSAFTADVKQTEYTKVVNKSDQTSVKVRLKRTDKGVFGIVRYLEPDPHTIRFTGINVEIYHPIANQLDIFPTGKNSQLLRDLLMLGFGTSGKDVKNTYTVKDGGSSMVGSRRTTRIELVPKEKKFKEYAEKIEVWIPEGETNPIQVKTGQPSGDYSVYVYSNVMLLKPPLKDSDFDWDPDQKPNKSTHETRN